MAPRVAGGLVLPRPLITVARIVAACLVYLAVLDTVVVIGYGVAQTLVPDAARGTFGLISLAVAEGAALLSVLAVWRLVDRRPVRAIGLYPDRGVPRWLKGAGIGALMMGFVVLVGYTLVDGASWDLNADPLRAGLAVVGGLIGFLIQGPSEEVLFRGYILDNVRRQWGMRQAVVVSSLSFALLHAYNPAFGVLPFINLLLFGVATALYRIYVDDDRLWGVFGIHTVWNWLQQVVFGLPNSGIASVPDNTLFTVTPNTSLPDAFWGGGFGPEGTLAASLVLLALIGVGLRRARRPSRHHSRRPRAVPTSLPPRAPRAG